MSRRVVVGASIASAMAALTGCSLLRDASGEVGVCTPGDEVEDADSAELVGGGSANDALEGMYLSPYGLAVSPDGTQIAANQAWDRRVLGASDTSGTTIWDTASGRIAHRFDNGMQGSIAWHPDGSMLALAGAIVVDLVEPSGSRLWRLSGHEAQERGSDLTLIRDVAFSPDGTVLATLGTDGTVRIWSTETGTCSPEHVITVDGLGARTLAFSPDGADLAVCGPRGPVEIWDPGTGSRRSQVEGDTGEPAALTYTSDGALIVCGEQPGTLLEIAEDGTVRAGPEISARRPDTVAVDREGVRVAATGGGSDVVTLWNRETDETTDLPGTGHTLNCLRWSPTGTALFGVNAEQGIHAWQDGEDWHTFELP